MSEYLDVYDKFRNRTNKNKMLKEKELEEER